MNNVKVFMLVTVICAYIQYSELLPITDSQPVLGNENYEDRMAEADFMAKYGVTQEEVEEFNRLSGYVQPLSGNGMNPGNDGQERTLGRITESLKFWNWPAFQDFRHWIEERRRRTTTIRPIPVYIVNNPNGYSYPYNTI